MQCGLYAPFIRERPAASPTPGATVKRDAAERRPLRPERAPHPSPVKGCPRTRTRPAEGATPGPLTEAVRGREPKPAAPPPGTGRRNGPSYVAASSQGRAYGAAPPMHPGAGADCAHRSFLLATVLAGHRRPSWHLWLCESRVASAYERPPGEALDFHAPSHCESHINL